MDNQETNFIKYCLEFYGEGGLDASDFEKPFTSHEIEAAAKLLALTGTQMEYDSVDREWVRDLICSARTKSFTKELV